MFSISDAGRNIPGNSGCQGFFFMTILLRISLCYLNYNFYNSKKNRFCFIFISNGFVEISSGLKLLILFTFMKGYVNQEKMICII